LLFVCLQIAGNVNTVLGRFDAVSMRLIAVCIFGRRSDALFVGKGFTPGLDLALSPLVDEGLSDLFERKERLSGML
jgi:hypothetical protein